MSNFEWKCTKCCWLGFNGQQEGSGCVTQCDTLATLVASIQTSKRGMFQFQYEPQSEAAASQTRGSKRLIPQPAEWRHSTITPSIFTYSQQLKPAKLPPLLSRHCGRKTNFRWRWSWRKGHFSGRASSTVVTFFCEILNPGSARSWAACLPGLVLLLRYECVEIKHENCWGKKKATRRWCSWNGSPPQLSVLQTSRMIDDPMCHLH